MRAAWPGHLPGPTVSALVDGQLTAAEAERALVHVSRCGECRVRVTEERAAARLLGQAGDVAPGPDLMARILSVPGRPPSSGPAPTRPPGVRRRRRAGAGLAAVGVVVVGGGLFLLGDVPRGLGPADLSGDGATALAALDREPPVDADGTALALVRMAEAGWAVPDSVPADLALLEAEVDESGTLVVVLRGDRELVVLTEHPGVVDIAALDARTERIGEVTAHVLTESPFTAVAQVGELVVTVACHGPAAAGRQVLAALPAGEPDLSAGERIERGWTVLTAAVLGIGG